MKTDQERCRCLKMQAPFPEIIFKVVEIIRTSFLWEHLGPFKKGDYSTLFIVYFAAFLYNSYHTFT